MFTVRANGQIFLRCTVNWTHVGKIPDDRGFYFLPTVPIGYSPQDCLKFSRYLICREMESASKFGTCGIGVLEPGYLED